MTKIHIFYAQISEEKNKKLKIHGPFIHFRPNEENAEVPPDDYIFVKDDYSKEKKFLVKFLRQKFPNRLTIFHFIQVPEVVTITAKCEECGYTHQLSLDTSGKKIVCAGCGLSIKVADVEEMKIQFRHRAMLDAHDYFDKKFKHMKDNYAVCTRKR